MGLVIQFANGATLEERAIKDICLRVLKTIENELPDEARSIEAYCHIINTCKDVLQEQKVVL